jgi:hypothetical protein
LDSEVLAVGDAVEAGTEEDADVANSSKSEQIERLLKEARAK